MSKNVKLKHPSTGRVLEVPEESAGPYESVGWERQKPTSGGTASKSKS